MTNRPTVLHVTSMLAAIALAPGCSKDRADASQGETRASSSVDARRAADMLYAIVEAERSVYTKRVVNRMTIEEPVEVVDPDTNEPHPLVASERWQSERAALPLPSQMFKMAADQVADRDLGLHYALLSQWPISHQNRAKTPAEEEGLAAIREAREPFYTEETLGETRYLTAMYPDIAIAQACVDCHNAHRDSPRTDFELGEVMGGVVIRIELE